jgi:soluble lytic murein transglycosylase
MDAWNAASRGDRSAFTSIPASLQQYELYPYLVYEQLRYQRARIVPSEMAAFLDQHADWAFAGGLRNVWLKTLGKQGKWEDFLQHYSSSRNAELRCLNARAMIETGVSEGLMAEARSLWNVGKSQVSECDPVFAWLTRNNGIDADLAWERVFLAMAAGNARFTLYLKRFLPPQERVFLERWQSINRNGYRNLDRARNWPDEAVPRKIAALSLKRFARNDGEKAWDFFKTLDGHFGWSTESRGSIIREIALQSAVALTPNSLEVMFAIPDAYRDDQVLQWWARAALVSEQWETLLSVIDQLPPESKSDGRWRYWQAFALDKSGQSAQAGAIWKALAREASYYGFLSADTLQEPYSICPLEPVVSQQVIDRIRQRADISRALELRAAGLENWALSEWSLAVSRLDNDELRAAAGLATQEDWHDRAIFALGDSGDRQFYEWRFPVLWAKEVNTSSAQNQLDAAWVHGVMRSESALAESARSSAGALGLMQVTPATARQLARENGYSYRSSEQLKEAELNIRFGTRYMRDLLERFDQNPVLVSGAYNAGPEAVNRWLNSRPRGSASVWIESIPYYETRDYIPRVLAFTAIYQWRMNQPVTRVSSRMPGLDSSKPDSGKMGSVETTEVVCEA